MIPTMVLAHTLFLGISSRPVDKNSPMFRLMDKKWPETGKPIIKSVIFNTICESCRRRGITDCNHEQEDPWSTELQNKKVKYLMSDDKTGYRREMRNEDVDDDNEPAFPYEAVMALGDSKWDFGGGEEQDYVFVGVDSAAGGAKSKYAVVSMKFPRVFHKKSKIYREQIVYLGADICDSKQPKTVYNMVALHLQKLRFMPGCKNSLFVIVPENNLAFEAEHLSDALDERVRHGYVVMEEKENEKGFKTDNMLKMAMAKSFRMELESNNVRFHNKFFSLTTPEGKLIDPTLNDVMLVDSIKLMPGKNKPMSMVYREAAENMRDVIIDQHVRYTRFVRPSKDEFKEPTIIYTAKHNGPGDDLSIISQALATMRKYFLTREKYKPWHRHKRT